MGKSLQTIIAYSFFLLLSISTITAAFSAQEKNNLSPTPMDEMTVEDEKMEGEAEEVEYTLPYPGILPDHPLYFLKILRDRMMDFLIRDPLKRVEFNLLMSDKRINMALFLSEKGKDELSAEIAKEAEDFYGRAIQEAAKAKEQQREISKDLLDKLANANHKHQEVIIAIQEKSPEDKKEGYEEVLKMINSAREKLQE